MASYHVGYFLFSKISCVTLIYIQMTCFEMEMVSQPLYGVQYMRQWQTCRGLNSSFVLISFCSIFFFPLWISERRISCFSFSLYLVTSFQYIFCILCFSLVSPFLSGPVIAVWFIASLGLKFFFWLELRNVVHVYATTILKVCLWNLVR